MKIRKRNMLICGVGNNDAYYPVYITKPVDGKKKNIWTCPYYSVWTGMLGRCYSERMQKKNPSYIGCSVVQDWMYFSAFREWMSSQDWQGKEIDKDILLEGNKVYGPETCVFISSCLNLFVIDKTANSGEYPVGVSFDKIAGKLRARCKNPFTGKEEYLGYFTDPDQGHEAWRARKHEHACRYADMQKDHRIADALRKRYKERSSA